VVLARSEAVGMGELPDKVKFREEGGEAASSLKDSVHEFERRLITKALEANRRNKESTAHALGIDLVTLYRKMKKLGIEG
jgi:transcriptional regulator with PAS, ATPase and Fis domain